MTVLVTMRHCRIAKVCAKDGVIPFFKRHPELDKREFIKRGLPVEQIEATGDVIALRVAKVARDGR